MTVSEVNELVKWLINFRKNQYTSGVMPDNVMVAFFHLHWKLIKAKVVFGE